MNKQKIAVFGSAFNPPHRGHEDVMQQIQGFADLTLVVPSYCHAFGKNMMPYDLRVKMVEAMVEGATFCKPVIVSRIEADLAKQKKDKTPIYTYDVLNAIEQAYPHTQIYFIIGPDNADPKVWKHFHKAEDITERWNTWVAEERLAIRSTPIRAKLDSKQLPSDKECPLSVIDTLREIYAIGG